MNLEEIDDIYESRKLIYISILEISPKSRFGPYARFHARRNGGDLCLSTKPIDVQIQSIFYYFHVKSKLFLIKKYFFQNRSMISSNDQLFLVHRRLIHCFFNKNNKKICSPQKTTPHWPQALDTMILTQGGYSGVGPTGGLSVFFWV
jgi:hypothetical protein